MKRYFKIIMLLSLLLNSLPANAQTFSEVDFERLLMKHPMMKNYDPKTGHFNNTPYELKDVATLKSDNASMAVEIEEIKKKEIAESKSIITDDIEDEENFWNSVSDLSKRKETLEFTILKNKELISSDGDPGYEKMIPIIDDMCNDVFIPLYNKDKVILNKLPRYFYPFPDFNGMDMRRFWNKRDPRILERYLENASVLAMIFSKSDKTILYQRSGANK